MGELTGSLHKVNKLFAACDEWLTDANDAAKYDLGPRAQEVTVTYLVPTDKGFRKEKATLAELLARTGEGFVEEVQSKHADPRELILKTACEVRQVVATCADLAKTLADIRVMMMFREAVLAEIAKVEPEVAERITEAIRRSLVLQGFLGESPDVRWESVN